MSRVCIVGGGPAGLMAAEVIAASGAHVDVYDAMPSVGRKFLMAGKGGLNLTHSEPLLPFLARYGARRSHIEPWLNAFGPQALCDWAHALGVETFTGSSGRVFPKNMKAAPLLRAWLRRLREAGVAFHMRHRWIGWDSDGLLQFATPQGMIHVSPAATVLALGGGSWPKLGSDGLWAPVLAVRDVAIAPLKPANCGFECAWSEHLRTRYAGQPLKSIAASTVDVSGVTHRQQGECVVTEHGIEGGVIYALSATLREGIAARGSTTLHLDLAPGRDLPHLTRGLLSSRGKRSLSNHLQQQAGISGIKAVLLREVATPADLGDGARLAALIKALPLTLTATRPLHEAISSAGGVTFETIDKGLMLRRLPGVFCTGEMLDWEAPTGGYLLTACMASGRVAGCAVVNWLGTL